MLSVLAASISASVAESLDAAAGKGAGAVRGRGALARFPMLMPMQPVRAKQSRASAGANRSFIMARMLPRISRPEKSRLEYFGAGP